MPRAACAFAAQSPSHRYVPISWTWLTVGPSSQRSAMLDWGGGLDGGIVECGTRRALWLPYVEVSRVDEATENARRCGANVLLEPREGPAGWRSVVAVPDGAEIAFWQSKTAVPRRSPSGPDELVTPPKAGIGLGDDRPEG